jgi:hypothetical protein
MKHLDVSKVFTTLTTGALFALDRHKSRAAIEAVLNKIEPQTEPSDLASLEDLTICAPETNTLCTVIPSIDEPTMFLPPSFEDCSDSDHAERVIARGFAESIALKRNPGPAKLEGETNRILNRWGYPTVAQGHSQAAKAGTAA